MRSEGGFLGAAVARAGDGVAAGLLAILICCCVHLGLHCSYEAMVAAGLPAVEDAYLSICASLASRPASTSATTSFSIGWRYVLRMRLK